ncbi:MAG: Lrp/AsnC family transcriptional regulator [Aquifex sp.]|nr:MAG: Lrp/AsnC family transcriptional regulator [Aquifex sp.]
MELLKIIQEDIPLTERPFKYIADRLNISERDVIRELKKLKEQKIVRQISPIYDTRKAGYESSLVAFKVPPERIEEVANFVGSCPGVSHNYEREDEFNLWFTLAVPPDAHLGLEELVKVMAERNDVKEYVILKTVKTFKIGVRLNFDSLLDREDNIPEPKSEREEKIHITDFEKALIRETQEDLPLVEKPFEVISEKLGVSEKEVLEGLKNLKKKGVLRRFSSILFHRKMGFKANGMGVWRVDKERIDEVGKFFAGYKAVSHCYQRTTNEFWPYNLFTMIHGKKKEEVYEFCKENSERLGIKDYRVLFSIREFKKKRVKLFSPDFYYWEKELLKPSFSSL